MKLVTYLGGRAREIPNATNTQGAVIELTARDGRQLQVSFYEDGGVHIRGWGNVAAKVGNCNRLTVDTVIQFEEPTTCEVCSANLDEGCSCDDC